MFYEARYYDPTLGTFISPDTLVPDAGLVVDYNRFAYVRNNPLKYSDSSGHCIDGLTTIVCIAVILKVVDYGWSAYDAYNSGRTLADPNAPRSEKLMAGLNIALIVLFESIEPDEFLPVGLPADDIARHAMMKGVREAYAEGGEEAMQRFLAEQMGDQADGILGKVDELLGGCSFSADTPVMTQRGRMPIRQLQEGDWVLAYDETSGSTGVYPVTATFNHLDPVILVLVIDGERIETTPEHPFYADGAWVAAADLRVGDALRRVDGSVGLVESVRIERRFQMMYNLTVAQAYTFFVGDDGWLVHNACDLDNPLFEPGPYANPSGSIPATGPQVTRSQRREIQELGDIYGCHSCGAKEPGGTGTWRSDHQPPTSISGPALSVAA